MLTPGTGTGGGAVQIENSSGVVINPATGFAIPPYDEIDLGYTGSNNTTVTYKKLGVTVATLTLTYDMSDNLTSVVQT